MEVRKRRPLSLSLRAFQAKEVVLNLGRDPQDNPRMTLRGLAQALILNVNSSHLVGGSIAFAVSQNFPEAHTVKR